MFRWTLLVAFTVFLSTNAVAGEYRFETTSGGIVNALTRPVPVQPVRAMSVQNYLLGNFGLSPDRIRVAGYGEAMPIVPNSTDQNRQLNRRVEVQAIP